MTAIVSMLRAINLGSRNRIKMEDLRVLYESLGFENPRTFIQNGNVVFKSRDRNLTALAARIEKTVEQRFGFHSDVLVRTASDLRQVIAGNPFAAQDGIDPSRLLVTFLAREPSREAREKILSIETDPEELRMNGREIYIYFPNGMARPKLPIARIEKILQIPGTGRNLNTVVKLLEMAETL